MSNTILELRNVSKIYKMGEHEVKALDNVSLKISEGEFVSVTGPSGSGKSTLMHIIGLLDNPTFGSVFLDEVDVAKYTEQELAKVRNKKLGFIFQQFNLLARTSALENVYLPLIYNGSTEQEMVERAKNMLAMVGLESRADHHPSQLSGGQQQRVAIARALINNPRIILADEPTGNLDSKSGVEIIKIIQKLNEEGKTIVMVTHDMSIAKVAKRIVQIADGKIVNDEPNFQNTGNQE